MKKFLSFWFLVSGFGLLVARAASPSYGAFNANQFGTAGQRVVIKSGAVLTNASLVTPSLGAATALSLDLENRTLTSDDPFFAVTNTWNNATVTFTGGDVNIVDTASAAGSLLWNWRVNGTNFLSLTKAGLLNIYGSIPASGGAPIQAGRLEMHSYAGNAVGNLVLGTSSAGGPNIRLQVDGVTSHIGLNIGGSAYSGFTVERASAGDPTMFFSLRSPTFQTTGSGGVTQFWQEDTNLVVRTMDGPRWTMKPSGSLTIAGPTLTVSDPILNLSQEWNASGTLFTGIKFYPTNTASALGSLLLDFGLAPSTSLFKLDKGGTVTASGIVNAGADGVQLSSGGITVWNGASIGFSVNSSASGSPDVFLTRNAPGMLYQRNGVNAQTSLISGTYTDAANYRRLSLSDSTAGLATISSEGLGTGATGNSIQFSTDGITRLTIASTGEATFSGTVASANIDQDVRTTASPTFAAFSAANLYLGTLTITNGLVLSKTITAPGTTGAQTINKATGRVNFAAAAQTLVVTCNLADANSIIMATVATDDTTATACKAIPGAGTFTLKLNAAATAETAVAFLVVN